MWILKNKVDKMQTRVDPGRVVQAQPNAEQRNLEDNVTARHCRMRLILSETFGFWAQLLLREQIPFYNDCKFQGICQGCLKQVFVVLAVDGGLDLFCRFVRLVFCKV